MSELEFFRHHYSEELNRKGQLHRQLTPSIGVAALVAGVASYFVESFSYDVSWLTWVFLAALGTCAFAFLSLVYQLVKSVLGYEYRYLAEMDKLREWEQSLIEYHKALDADTRADDAAGSDRSHDARMEFGRDVVDRYARGAGHNARENNRRSAHMHKATVWMARLLVALFLAAVPYYLDKALGKNERAAMTKEEPPKKPQVQRPTPPPDQLIKEDSEKGRPADKK